jgi:two-component system response regulator YesN
MYKTLIVDDEPVYVRQIAKLLTQLDANFEVTSTAYDAVTVLKILESNRIDLLITDVRMPGVNGIELLKQVQERFPGMMSIIISGYSDFEYTKEAIRMGVSDYLLKPIDPDQFATTIKKASRQLDVMINSKKNELMENLAAGLMSDDESIRRFLPAGEYVSFIVNFGWYSKINNLQPCDNFLELHSYLEELLLHSFGRDNYILSNLSCRTWVGVVCVRNMDDLPGLIGSLSKSERNITIVNTTQSSEIGVVSRQMPELQRSIRSNARVSGFCYVNQEKQRSPEADKADSNWAVQLLQFGTLPPLLDYFTSMTSDWMKMEIPQIEAINALRNFVRAVQQKYCDNTGFNLQQGFENTLDEISNFQQLCALVESLIKECCYKGNNRKFKSADLFAKIDKYIEENIGQPISLTNICEMLHVSQPLISRAVRENVSRTFNQYVTYRRGEKAKRIIEMNPGIYFKQVAEAIGYSDHHYFSRVFMSLYGVSPTEYRDSILNPKQQ